MFRPFKPLNPVTEDSFTPTAVQDYVVRWVGCGVRGEED